MPSYTWKKDTNEVSNTSEARYSNDGKTLTIPSVKQSDAGSYTCQVSQLSYSTKESNGANLIVYCMFIFLPLSISL